MQNRNYQIILLNISFHKFNNSPGKWDRIFILKGISHEFLFSHFFIMNIGTKYKISLIL